MSVNMVYVNVLVICITVLQAIESPTGPLVDRTRHEASDIAKLAALTRIDHSTIFFRWENTGYIRDGVFHPIVFNDPVRKPLEQGKCRGRAVSRDGSRIAYVVPTADDARCTVLVRDLRTDADSRLVDVEESWGPLAWSWDDNEIAYQRRGGIFAVSTKDGHERTLAHLPTKVAGEETAEIHSIDWFHKYSGLLANVVVCLPTGTGGKWKTCNLTDYVLTLGPDASRVVAVGGGATVSPQRDEIAFVTSTNAEVIGVDQRYADRITTIPFTLWWLPIFREDPIHVVWSPEGDRFWFSTILDEESHHSFYLVDVKTRARQRLLTHTSIYATDWR
jgi:hypothetical protein